MRSIASAWWCAAAVPLLFGCSSSSKDEGTAKAAVQTDGGLINAADPNPACGTNGVINSNIGAKFLEIEAAIAAGTTCRGQVLASAAPYNANLWVGTSGDPGLDNHPTDGTPVDFDHCFPGPGTPATSYIDWADLAPANHTCNDALNDQTAFGTGPCVVVGTSPQKGDLTGVAFASNSSQLYLAFTRKDNNGAVSFTAVFTKDDVTSTSCSGGFVPTYHVQTNDIVIRGSYPQSSGAIPVINAWRFSAAPTGDAGADAPATATYDAETLIESLPASGASNTTWTLVSSTGVSGGIVAAANVDPTKPTPVLPHDPGALVTIPKPNGAQYLQPEIALEMAVPLTTLVGGTFSACSAASFHVDVISQSSDQYSSDLKDYIGGIFLNLGELSATPAVTTSCNGAGTKVDYSVGSITGRNGVTQSADATGEFTGFKCDWSCTGPSGATASATNDCKGSLTGLAAGSWTCSVTVTETAGDQCAKTVATPAVTVYGAVALNPSMVGSCAKSFTYDAQATGGSGGLTCAWTFSGGPTGTPTSSSSCSGSSGTISGAFPSGGSLVSGTVTVTDNRGCQATLGTNAAVYQSVDIQISPDATSLTCPGLTNSNDHVTFTATVTGGSAATPSISWTAPGTCSGTSCVVDFTAADTCPAGTSSCGSGSVQASVTDATCGNDASATYNVSKTTTITAAIAP
ncbi:MAG: hypothetical protein HYV09_26190 [Deltaproteobacteria bacterium]|nr:hypothetical protein [Deltaproteobacteria bacterium]